MRALHSLRCCDTRLLTITEPSQTNDTPWKRLLPNPRNRMTTRSSTLDLTDNNARAKTTQPKQSTVPLPLTRVTVRQQLTRYYLTTDREACVALSKSDYDLVRFHCAFVLVRYARRSRAHARDRFIARRYTAPRIPHAARMYVLRSPAKNGG